MRSTLLWNRLFPPIPLAFVEKADRNGNREIDYYQTQTEISLELKFNSLESLTDQTTTAGKRKFVMKILVYLRIPADIAITVSTRCSHFIE